MVLSGSELEPQNSVQNADVLVVDDDTILLKRVTHALENAGFQCFQASSVEQMGVALSTRPVDAIVMDLGLPDADGMVHIESVVQTSDAPLIVLTSRSAMDDRLKALHLGADDYLTKPCDMRELTARVTAVIRPGERRQKRAPAGLPVSINGWVIEAAQNSLISAQGDVVSLSTKEFELLSALAGNAPKTLTRKWLTYALHQREWEPEDRTIDNLVSRLRKKLRPLDETSKIIEANRLNGYRLILPITRAS